MTTHPTGGASGAPDTRRPELVELFGVRRGDDGTPFGPPEREECENLIAADPSLVLVHYFSTAWTEVTE